MSHRLYLFAFLLLSITSSAQHITTELKATWQFRKQGESQWMRAIVPGTVHTDLLANRKIPDPFYRDNESQLQWIEKENWEYQGSFLVDGKTLGHQHINLVFNGLDTYAQV